MGPIIADVYSETGREMIVHHYEVLEAIKRRDGRDAAQAITDDIVKGGRTVRERIQAPR
jgi:DNA-binding GntR family transcriptional regulator